MDSLLLERQLERRFQERFGVQSSILFKLSQTEPFLRNFASYGKIVQPQDENDLFSMKNDYTYQTCGN